MATTVIAYGTEGPTLTVSALLKDPLKVPPLVKSVLERQFIADQVLRNAGRAEGGAVQFWESAPLFPENDVEVLGPRGQIPEAIAGVGTPLSKPTVGRGLGLVITDEMARRNNMGEVQRQLTVLRNGMLKSIDGQLMAALRAATTNTLAVATAWSQATATIRKNVARARKLIRDQELGFEPNALIINPTTEEDLLGSDEIQKPYVGEAAGDNPALRGTLGPKFWDMSLYVSRQVVAGEAWVVEQKTVGGFADEVPLEVDGPHDLRAQGIRAVRHNIFRKSAGFIDQPLAATKLSGV
jgi:hypothetical protein